MIGHYILSNMILIRVELNQIQVKRCYEILD